MAIDKLTPAEVLQIRRALGKTQREMSDITGVAERTYRVWETRSGAKPPASTLLRRLLADAQAGAK